MPVHDWTGVDAGLFHAFRQSWIIKLCDALNADRLPADDFALPEQSIRGPIPDVLIPELAPGGREEDRAVSSLAKATRPPRTKLVRQAEDRIYIRKASRITVRHRHGHVIAVIEIVSPGNKASHDEMCTFVEKASDLIMQGAHLLIIDVFPPSNRDPQGMYKAIWDQFVEEDFELPADKPLTLAAYDAGPPPGSHIDFVAVGDALPEMPVFLKPGFYVQTPLELPYQAAWQRFSEPMKKLLEEPIGESAVT